MDSTTDCTILMPDARSSNPDRGARYGALATPICGDRTGFAMP